ncbi:PadR family transcriptional regulator [Kitasatospora sp. NPDC054939]
MHPFRHDEGACGPRRGPRGPWSVMAEGEYEGRRAAFGHFGPGPGPFGPPGFGPFGGRGRARKGNVRASVLALLAERPMHGYEMIKEIGERSGGAWTPSPGSVYPTLQMLEDEELIASETSGGGKKLFTLTEAGRAQAEAGPQAPWEASGAGFDRESMLKARQAGAGLMEAFAQVWRTGTPKQQEKALEILDEARRKLYLTLAGEA